MNVEIMTSESENNFCAENNIFRYKFADDFAEDLYNFSKIHQYDDRISFKEAWTVWLEENREIVETEVRRLTNLNYEGDIFDKMFKSARYYFRKKSTEKKEPKMRRAYTGLNKRFLEDIDQNIKRHIVADDYKPAIGFINFCEENKNILEDEVNNLIKNGFTDKEEIMSKIKKTYKNRYFRIISK
jgi:hypothetical protein